MAVVVRDRRGVTGGRVFGFGTYRGLGDVASDAILKSSWGAADYAAWQSAVAALPAGYTMGDPTTPLWGKGYYNGVALMSPPDDAATYAAIQAAADLAYKIYAPIDSIRSSTNPYMVAVLTDPEWIEGEGSGQPLIWANLSPELQAKIKLVPNLYNAITGNLSALSPPTITSGPTVATGPARYLQSGIEFLSDGTVVSYNGTPVPTGTTLTSAEVQSLLTTGQLPPGDTGPSGMVTVAPVAPVPDAPPAPPSSSSAAPPAVSSTSYTYTPPPSPAPYGPALVSTSYVGANDSTGLMPGGGGGGGGFSTGSGSGGGGSLPPAGSGSSGFLSALGGRTGLLVGAGVAALAFLMQRGQPSGRRRRRRR